MSPTDNIQNSDISEETRNRYAQLKGMESNGELDEISREELNQLRVHFEKDNSDV
jgi:hypothetical protein